MLLVCNARLGLRYETGSQVEVCLRALVLGVEQARKKGTATARASTRTRTRVDNENKWKEYCLRQGCTDTCIIQIIYPLKPNTAIKLFMTDTQPEPFTWKNRQQYSNNPSVQHAADKTLNTTDIQDEIKKVSELFEIVNNNSQASVVHFDEKERTMALYHCPNSQWKRERKRQFRSVVKTIDDIRNYFNYRFELTSRGGERGYVAGATAIKNMGNSSFRASYHKTLWGRLDDHFTNNLDTVALTYVNKTSTHFSDLWHVQLARSSRENQMNPFKKGTFARYGLGKDESSRITHSNMNMLSCSVKKGPLWMSGVAGYDWGNGSLFAKTFFKAEKTIQRQEWDTYIKCILEGGNVWGRNLLKNDMLFRNKISWPGNKSTNFISPRLELHLPNYPLLSLLQLKPYLYLQGWLHQAHDSPRNKQHIYEADYGIGVVTGNESQIECSLFSAKNLRSGEGWGRIKFRLSS